MLRPIYADDDGGIYYKKSGAFYAKYATETYLRQPTLSDLKPHAAHGFFLLSAMNDDMTAKENQARLAALRRDVRQSGLSFISLIGHYKNGDWRTARRIPETEVLLFVPYPGDGMDWETFETLAESLAEKYEQCGYITGTPGGIIWLHERSGQESRGYGNKSALGKLDTAENIALKFIKAFSLLKADYLETDTLFVFDGYRVPARGFADPSLFRKQGEMILP